MTDCRIELYDVRPPGSTRVVGGLARCTTHPEWLRYSTADQPREDLTGACAAHHLEHTEHAVPELVSRVTAIDARGRCLVVHLDDTEVGYLFELEDGATVLASILDDLRVSSGAAEVIACTGTLDEITAVDPVAALESALAGIADHPGDAAAEVLTRLRAADLHLITARPDVSGG